MSIVIAILASVVLAAPFSTASAAAVDDTDGITVEITVEYPSGAEAVIARPYSSFEELPPTAMADLGDDVWGALVRFPTAENWSVAFEAFAAGGSSTVSDSATLLELGVDPVVIATGVTAPLPSDPLIPDGSWWLIVGIGLAFAALVALSFWTFAGARRGDGGQSGPGDPAGEKIDEAPPG